jgi:AcrR family transcriptional regulator
VARRDEILDAALRCFTDKGFGATTIEDVRQASGASVGSIYHHFGGKEQLAASLYAEGLRDYQGRFLRTLERHRDDARAAIETLVLDHVRWIVEHPDLAGFLLGRREGEVRRAADAAARELNRAFFRTAATWFAEQASRGAIRRLSFDLYAALLIGPSQELARHWLAGNAKTSLEDAAPALAAAAWASLRPDHDEATQEGDLSAAPRGSRRPTRGGRDR